MLIGTCEHHFRKVATTIIRRVVHAASLCQGRAITLCHTRRCHNSRLNNKINVALGNYLITKNIILSFCNLKITQISINKVLLLFIIKNYIITLGTYFYKCSILKSMNGFVNLYLYHTMISIVVHRDKKQIHYSHHKI